LPQPGDPAAGDPAAPPPPPEIQPPHEDDARPWAGDVYDEGDETDPAQAYASLSGPNGEQAWLDKAEDGTLTGWVRDETGQVWRYSDPDTWAIDVDDAGMQETGGTHGAPPAGEEQDPAAIDPNAPAAPDAAPIEFGTADEVADPDAENPDDADPAAEEDPAAADEDPEAEDDEDPEAEDDEQDDGAPKKKGGKPWK
ncbi:hypothetical protein ABZX91_38255, partial [Streptomyces coeruleorubidus]